MEGASQVYCKTEKQVIRLQEYVVPVKYTSDPEFFNFPTWSYDSMQQAIFRPNPTAFTVATDRMKSFLKTTLMLAI